jgi:HPt (histidine-containing phosphotransfer) domain-containing protein
MSERPDDWIADLWEQVRPSAAAKVAVIASAAAAAGSGPLDEAARAEAWQEAHRLAGSLGSYGHHDAASAAGELERLLADGPVAGGAPLTALVRRLEAVAGSGRAEARS